jgi:hypothetical protein
MVGCEHCRNVASAPERGGQTRRGGPLAREAPGAGAGLAGGRRAGPAGAGARAPEPAREAPGAGARGPSRDAPSARAGKLSGARFEHYIERCLGRAAEVAEAPLLDHDLP